MAERQGFEPWVALLPQLISSQSRSATPASLHGASLLPEPPLEINLNLFKDQMTVDKKDNATALVTMIAAMVRGTTRRHSPGARALVIPRSWYLPDPHVARHRL